MGFDSSAAEMDQQGGHEHLAGSDDISRGAESGIKEAKQDREDINERAENNRHPDMEMEAALRSRPCPRRYPQRYNDARDPLHEHQDREHAVGLPADRTPMRM